MARVSAANAVSTVHGWVTARGAGSDSDQPDMLEAALAMLERGWSVFPVAVERTAKGYSKRPLSQRPLKQRFAPEELAALWPAAANGIGVELGAVSQLLRLDAEGPVPWEQLGDKPESGCFYSPSGGFGWIMEYVDGVRTDRIWDVPGEHAELRLMSDGTFTVLPPSEGYMWLNEPTPARMPQWLLDRQAKLILDGLCKELRPTDREPERDEVLQALQHIPPDDYERWVQVGMALKQSGFELTAWDSWSRSSSKYVEGECEKKWNSFQRVGRTVSARSVLYWAEEFGYKRPNRYEPITELGNAKVLARIGEGKVLHSAHWGWLAFDGRRWSQGAEAVKLVQELQKEVLRIRLDAATRSLQKHMSSDRQASDYAKKLRAKTRTITMIRRHEDARSMEGSRQLASSEPQLSVSYKLFDRKPLLLNCANGTLDLQLRCLQEHDPADLLTQLCSTPYHPEASCPRWEQFLAEVFADAELIAFVQRLLGYCVTGLTTNHVLPIWYGTGRNGKSTLVRAVLNVLGGDYACTTSSNFLTADRNSHPTKIADLYGKRFAADLETGDGMKLDEELTKRLTGGDQLTARRMREDFWRFDPTHKLVLATNYEPAVRNQDPAIWGRILKIPFDACFLGREDYELDDKLAAEAPGILRWLVEGCYSWLDSGLRPPERIRAATEAYKEEQNTVAAFAGEMLKKGTAEQRTLKSVVTTAYRGWCQLNSKQPVGPRAFGLAMVKLGIDCDKNYYNAILIGGR